MTVWPRSIRVRLTAWYTLALAIILLVFTLAVYANAHRSTTQQILGQLAKDQQAIENMLRHEPDELEELEEHAAIRFFRVDQGEKTLCKAGGWTRLDFDGLVSSASRSHDDVTATIAERRYRLHVASLVNEGKEYVVFVATDAEAPLRALDDLRHGLLIGFPVALLLGCVGGYVLAGQLLSPVGTLADKAHQITAERLAERLPVGNPHDEFGRLATTFNAALARLDDAFQRLRRFTSDASHELRTPLTAIRTVGEVALRDGNNIDRYREAIGSMLEEVDRLTHLVDSLLVLTRSDSGTATLKREPLELSPFICDVIDHLRPLAEEKSQTIDADLGASNLVVAADRLTLRHALINLLDNAIKYSPAGSPIHVSVGRAADEVVIAVLDKGPGIPGDEQEKVFERFYRIDKARSRDEGGTGLGLAIARWAVEANGGRIELDSNPGQGSTFRIVMGSGSLGDETTVDVIKRIDR